MISLFFIGMIYAAFISLGLPDALLGSAWPAVWPELGVPVDSAGILSMTVTCGTIVSSLLADKLLHRFGTGRVTLVSVSMTAAALAGFAAAPTFGCLWALSVPLGLGAGAVDAGLNNFVALHYGARHMSWLHCFWGVGATLGPILMARFLASPGGWHKGYALISGVQWALVALLACTLPLWNRYEDRRALRAEAVRQKRAGAGASVLRLPGVPSALLGFFFYCASETTAGLWAASYLVEQRGAQAGAAAGWVSMYYLGITAGRFVCGVLAARVPTKTLVRLGQALSAVGAVLLALPLPAGAGAAALWLIGLGFAPVYPSMIHETPRRFGVEHSQAVIGLQMACAYAGSTLMPPLFGLLAGRGGMALLPFYLLAAIAGMTVCCERLRGLRAPQSPQNGAL